MVFSDEQLEYANTRADALKELIRTGLECAVDVIAETGLDALGGIMETILSPTPVTNVFDEPDVDDSMSVKEAQERIAGELFTIEQRIVKDAKLNRAAAVQTAIDETLRVVTRGTAHTPPMKLVPLQNKQDRLLTRMVRDDPEKFKDDPIPENYQRGIWPLKNISAGFIDTVQDTRRRLAESAISD